MKFPRLRIHLLTAIILQIELGALIWANVRPIPWDWMEEVAKKENPETYDPRIKFVHTHRGWPLTAYSETPPLLLSGTEFRIYHSWSCLGATVDCAAIFVSMAITWLACERLIYKKPNAKGAA